MKFDLTKLKSDISNVNDLKGTYDQDCPRFYQALDRILEFAQAKIAEVTIKVYRMNDYDWWADYSILEARKNYITWQKEQAQLDEEDIDVDHIVEMSDDSMENLKYYNDGFNTVLTFKEELARNYKVGFFASTDH